MSTFDIIINCVFWIVIIVLIIDNAIHDYRKEIDDIIKEYFQCYNTIENSNYLLSILCIIKDIMSNILSVVYVTEETMSYFINNIVNYQFIPIITCLLGIVLIFHYEYNF